MAAAHPVRLGLTHSGDERWQAAPPPDTITGEEGSVLAQREWRSFPPWGIPQPSSAVFNEPEGCSLGLCLRPEAHARGEYSRKRSPVELRALSCCALKRGQARAHPTVST